MSDNLDMPDDEQAEETNGTSFSNDVEGLDLTEFAPAVTDADVDEAFQQLADEKHADLPESDKQIIQELHAELDSPDFAPGLPEGFQEWVMKEDVPADPTLIDEAPAGYIGDGKFIFDESPAKLPPETTQRARLEESEFYFYQKGAQYVLDKLREIVELTDEDDLAIAFCQLMPADTVSPELVKHAEDAQAWAATQTLDDVSTERERLQGVREVILLDDGTPNVGGMQMVYTKEDLAIMIADLYFETQHQAKAIREHNHQLNVIEQTVQRGDYGAELWAVLSEWFNLMMPEPSDAETGMPLLERIQHYVVNLQDAALPPEIKSLLQGEPENDMVLTESQKVVLMVNALKRKTALYDRFFEAGDMKLAEILRDFQVDMTPEDLRQHLEDATKYRNLDTDALSQS